MTLQGGKKVKKRRNPKWLVWLGLCLITSVFLTACGGSPAGNPADPQPAEQERELNVFNWSEYLPQSVIDQFEAEYGIKVNYDTFSSNEEMLAKISAGAARYDLTVATDYMVDIMIKQGLLEPIDKNNIPNLKNLDQALLKKPHDPEGNYFVPYMWGGVVIAINTDKIKTPITGYKDLWKPEFNHTLVVPDDMRSMIGVANLVQGKSLNETDPQVLEKSKQLLQELQPNIKAYDSDSPKTMLINGEAAAGIVWGAEAYLAKQENPAIQTILAEEGMELFQDNFVIPKGAPHKKEAELFMDFILRPEISAEISKEFPYANPNLAAHQLIDPQILEDQAVYIPSDAMKRGEYMTDLGKATTDYDRIWSEIKQ